MSRSNGRSVKRVGMVIGFAQYEYHGADYTADVAWLAAQPRYREWLSRTDPMQIPLKGESSWAEMEEVYYNE